LLLHRGRPFCARCVRQACGSADFRCRLRRRSPRRSAPGGDRMRRSRLITLTAAAWLYAAAFVGTLLWASGDAAAQSYPNRPITLVVPYPPGGATDAIGRTLQNSMSQALGQQVVIENIGGAGGMIAAGRAARAAPDGYTVVLHQVALAAGMALYPHLRFDAEKDFGTVARI